MSDLIERLRRGPKYEPYNVNDDDGSEWEWWCDVTDEAADALEARDKTIAELVEALEKCAQRNRYDGDLFHDQGLESRMEASWSAWEDASKLLYRISQAQSKDKAE